MKKPKKLKQETRDEECGTKLKDGETHRLMMERLLMFAKPWQSEEPWSHC